MAQTTPLILILDQGSHASRAMLYDLRGQAISSYHIPLEPEHPDAIRSEYPADAPYATLRHCINQVLSDIGDGIVLAAALACQRSSIACWDRQDNSPLSPVISWQDRRTEADLTHWKEHSAHIQELTGLRLSTYYGATKLRWCLHNLPQVKAAKDRGRLACGPLASRLVWQLTREHGLFIDPANAARTLLIDHASRDWSPLLLELFDLNTAYLPTCVSSDYDFGLIPSAVGDIPLKLVTGDQSAALYAHGPLRKDTLYATLGTGAFLTQPTAEWVTSDQLLTTVVHDDGTRRDHALEGTINGAGSALSWFKETTEAHAMATFQEDLPLWMANKTDPPIFLNGVHGLGTPFSGAKLRSRFIATLGNQHPDLGDRAVAVIESIVFLLEENRRTMLASGTMARQIVIGGGLSRLDGLCQRLADLTGLPIRRCSEPETTGHGLAFLLIRQLTGYAVFNLEGGLVDDFAPRPNTALAARFTNWQAAMQENLSHD